MASILQSPIFLSFGIHLEGNCKRWRVGTKIGTATVSLLCLVQVHAEIASECSIELNRVSLGTTAVAKCTQTSII